MYINVVLVCLTTYLWLIIEMFINGWFCFVIMSNVLLEANERCQEFVQNLSVIETSLVEFRDVLYDGDTKEDRWNAMVDDLTARSQPKSSNGRAYNHTIAGKCTQDLGSIAKLRAYESRHNIDLADLIF
jgi:hypothetical protein